jgi:ABC-type sugar transport system, permease component
VDHLAVLQEPRDHRGHGTRHVLPDEWTWANYSGIFSTSEFTRPLLNSIGIGLIATFISVVLASLAAYAVARLASSRASGRSSACRC